MKFKKIEIQAFRAYNKVENGTFDFKIGNDEVADFISLYAPNGFGKTSFYDAIEYGFTNNIHRLLKDRGLAKSEKNIGEKRKHFILRNRNSNLDSFVRLFTYKPEKTIQRDIDEPRQKGSSDFKFNV